MAPFGRFLLNSLGTSLCDASVADLAGRRRRLRQIQLPRPPLLFRLIIATAIVPFESYLIPLYLQLNAIGWINTYQGIVLPYLFMASASS